MLCQLSGTDLRHILLSMDIASDWERQRARDVAKAALEGQISILEAVRKLFPLAHTDAVCDEADRGLIIGIYSETDHLPVGEVRRLWAPEALREKDIEIASVEAWWKATFLEACKRIAEGGLNHWPTRSQPQ